MNSLHLVDPALRPLLDAFPTDETLAETRARQLPMPPAADSDVALEVVGAPGPSGAPDISLHI